MASAKVAVEAGNGIFVPIIKVGVFQLVVWNLIQVLSTGELAHDSTVRSSPFKPGEIRFSIPFSTG
jgi:hypothetical protein